MGNFRFEWVVPMYVIEHGWAKAREQFVNELEFEMSMVALRLESFARTNHVWQNRTGDAESTFSVEFSMGERRMVMEHGVYYGKYLENMQGGRFAILPATITHGKPLISEGMQRALDKSYRR